MCVPCQRLIKRYMLQGAPPQLRIQTAPPLLVQRQQAAAAVSQRNPGKMLLALRQSETDHCISSNVTLQ